ncbi:MAG: alpha-galactosidase, partial [Muribaculaceae bacterium]|nr:alpha-galactosidase [Muribaculaceae bacterium]
KMSDEQLADIVKHCKANGQKAGIYFTPFSDWGKNPEAYINGNSGYKCKDAYLYANGKTQNMVAGGLAMDSTHPAIIQRTKETIEKFKRLGYEYLKIDFMTHGIAEADYYYDKNIFTGKQAYNYGMNYVREFTEGMFVTMAISPIFPAQYVHSRRIACDAWAGIGDSEYTLNALTYGWWIKNIYSFNDPDHLLLEPATAGENRARITSGVITGIFMNGDDLSEISGLEIAKKKAKEFLTNKEINAIAKIGKSFRPVNGNSDTADFLFEHHEGNILYLAAFNYSGYDLQYNVSVKRLGLKKNKIYNAKELWRGEKESFKDSFIISVPRKDAKVYKIVL